MNFDALFLQKHALPTIPKVVQEVIESFNNDHIAMQEVAHKLAADQVLSAKILRLANSSYYHVSRSIGTVDDAVLMLGFMAVRTLVVSTGLTCSFKSMPGFDLKKFWRYSLHTAVVAKWLAHEKKINSDFAFTVGMMHGIGQLVMHAAMPEKMLEVDKIASALDARRFDVENNSFGYSFADVGAELADRWNFPNEFSLVIRTFPNPLAQEPIHVMAGIIHLAVWRSRAIEHGLNDEELCATFPQEVAMQLDLSVERVITAMPPIEQLCEGLESLIS